MIKHILSYIADGALAAVMVIMIFLGYGSINNRWYRVVTIDGNSMAPTFYLGDVMLVTPPKQVDQIAPGTILLMNVDQHMVTHRLVRWDGERPITRGDANPTEDPFSAQPVIIEGIYWFHLPKVGYVNLFFKQLLQHSQGA